MSDDYRVCPRCRQRDPFMGLDHKRLLQTYDIGVDKDGYFYVRFQARCEDCGFSFIRNSDEPAWGAQAR